MLYSDSSAENEWEIAASRVARFVLDGFEVTNVLCVFQGFKNLNCEFRFFDILWISWQESGHSGSTMLVIPHCICHHNHKSLSSSWQHLAVGWLAISLISMEFDSTLFPLHGIPEWTLLNVKHTTICFQHLKQCFVHTIKSSQVLHWSYLSPPHQKYLTPIAFFNQWLLYARAAFSWCNLAHSGILTASVAHAPDIKTHHLNLDKDG